MASVDQSAFSVLIDGAAISLFNKCASITASDTSCIFFTATASAPEFKECKFTTEAIITEGADADTIHKVCANPACPVHHPKRQTSRDDEKWKAERETWTTKPKRFTEA
jgi:hypothetical protein